MAEQQHHVFRPERTHLLAAIIMILLSLFIIGSDLLYLFWLPLLPVVFIMWVVRAHTIVDDTGITAHPAFAQPTTTDWADIAGIGFGRSQAFLQTKEGKKITLPGVTFNSLPQLEAASAGRYSSISRNTSGWRQRTSISRRKPTRINSMPRRGIG